MVPLGASWENGETFKICFSEMSAGDGGAEGGGHVLVISDASDRQELTIKVAGVVFRFQLRDELRLLPQQAVPVQVVEKLMLLHLGGSSCVWNHITTNQ